MGKKVDLNKPKTNNSSIRKSNRNFYHPKSNYANNETDPEQTPTNNSPSNFQKKVAETALRAVGMPKVAAKTIANSNKTYEIADKANITIKMPIVMKTIIPVLLVVGVPFIALMSFIMFFSDTASASSAGIGGYSHYDDACTQVKVDSKLMSIDEYVEGVLSNYDDNYSDEVLKVLSIGIRTNLIETGTKNETDANNCYYDASSSEETYSDSNISERVKTIVNSTRGLVITTGGSANAYYDESCVYTAKQATELDSDNTYSDENYYIKYGEQTIGGTNFQEIPKSDIDVGTLKKYVDKAEKGTPCADNNGYGMSLNGAIYLEQNEGYDWEKIINYYYDNSVEIMTTNKSYGYTGEYPIEPSNELYGNLQFLLDESFSSFLQSQGSSVESFNNHIKSAVEDAGVGTRDGVVSAAVTLIGSLAEMGTKLNYQWGGKHAKIGVNPNWGLKDDADRMAYLCGPQSYGDRYNDSDECFANYVWQSFDCSGFVTWAVINGMQNTSITQSQIKASPSIPLDSNQAVCKVGGMLESTGHIVLIVGIDEANKNYIVAESTGSDISTGVGGVILSNYAFGRTNYHCLNLDEIYGD